MNWNPLRKSFLPGLLVWTLCCASTFTKAKPTFRCEMTAPSVPADGGPQAREVIRLAMELLAQGEDAARRGDYALARLRLDEAVDCFLDSGFDLRTDSGMRSAYREVVDRAHSISMCANENYLGGLQESDPPLVDVEVLWDAADQPGRPCERLPEPDSALATFKLLAKDVRARGEFETTPQFESYRRQLAASLGIGTKKYCFQVGVNSPFGLEYDADRAEFSLQLVSVSKRLKSSSLVVLAFEGRYTSPSRPRVELDTAKITVTIGAAPDVARRVKPLFAGYQYYVVGHVVERPNGIGQPPMWVGAISEFACIFFQVEEFIIARGVDRCIVARIPLSSRR